MVLLLAKPGDVAARNILSLGSSENFSIELSWKTPRKDIDIDAHVLMLKNSGNGERSRLVSDDHVLSTFNVGLPLVGNGGVHEEGDTRPFHLVCSALYHSGKVRINKGASVDEIIKISRTCIPDGINEMALFLTIFPTDVATMSEVKKVKVVIKNSKGEELTEVNVAHPYFDTFDAVQLGSLFLKNGKWEYVGMGKGWNGGFGAIYDYFKIVPEQPKPTPVEAPKTASQPVVTPPSPRKETIELNSMAAKFPGIPRETLREARNVIYNTDVSKLTTIKCASFGEAEQLEYSKLVDDSYLLTSDKHIKESVHHLARLNELLTELAGTFEKKKHFWESGEKPWEKLGKVRPEIDQLKDLLRQALPHLNTINERLSGLNEKSTKVAHVIDIMSVAGQYLSEQLGNDQNRSSALLSRSMSLTQTAAQMIEGTILRKSSIETVETLVSRIRDTILVMLPSWMDSVAYFALQASVTETDLYRARNGITDILQKLK
jgi:stress response protein SCP2